MLIFPALYLVEIWPARSLAGVSKVLIHQVLNGNMQCHEHFADRIRIEHLSARDAAKYDVMELPQFVPLGRHFDVSSLQLLARVVGLLLLLPLNFCQPRPSLLPQTLILRQSSPKIIKQGS